VWANIIGPHLTARDMVALSVTSCWGYRTAHSIINHTGYAKVTTPDSCCRASTHWPHVKFALELRSSQQLQEQQNGGDDVANSQEKEHEKMEVGCEVGWCPVASLTVWGAQGADFDFDFVDASRLDNLVVCDPSPMPIRRVQHSFQRLLAFSSCLRSLQLTCWLDDVQWLADALTCLRHLKTLDLRGNNLGPEKTKQLSSALTHVPHLTSLNLYDNQLTTEGLKCILPALHKMSNMKQLDLGYNDLDAEGAKHVSQLLPCLPCLTSLQLSVNRIQTEGAFYLMLALAPMSHMSYLNLSLNQLNNQIQQIIRKKLPHITEIWLS